MNPSFLVFCILYFSYLTSFTIHPLSLYTVYCIYSVSCQMYVVYVVKIFWIQKGTFLWGYRINRGTFRTFCAVLERVSSVSEDCPVYTCNYFSPLGKISTHSYFISERPDFRLSCTVYKPPNMKERCRETFWLSHFSSGQTSSASNMYLLFIEYSWN